MALGDNGSNNNNNYENTYYSRLRFRSDNMSFGFAFWKGMLKISISQPKPNTNEYDELAVIHLSPMKARVLANELEKLKTFSYTDGRLVGVDTGISDTRNIVAFGIDTGKSTEESIARYAVIGKVDPDGNLLNPVRFNFNVDYNFAIEWNDLNKMDCVKSYDNDLELDFVITILKEFYQSMTGAIAYSVIDMGRFDNSRLHTKLELIMDALHIERKGKNFGGDSSNSYFNRNGAASPQNSNRGRSNAMSIEDLENM